MLLDRFIHAESNNAPIRGACQGIEMLDNPTRLERYFAMMTLNVRLCLGCGKPFQPNRPYQVCCKASCRWRVWAVKHAPNVPDVRGSSWSRV